MITEEKTRMLLTIRKELKETLAQMAKDDDRSLNNFIIRILENYVKNHK